MTLALPMSLLSLLLTASARIITVPPNPSSDASTATYTLNGDLDSPKLDHVDGQSYDWWYFDAVSKQGYDYRSLNVVFYTSSIYGFDILAPFVPISHPSVNLIQITVGFPNGSIFDTWLNETQATFITYGNGISGTYPESHAVFSTTPDVSSATLAINAPDAGFEGTLFLQSVAPPHGPCAAAKKGISLELLPHIGWVNAMPDATAYAAFKVNGEPIVFNGDGYHDKNWGDAPFSQQFDSWYWGHAKLGDYSIVYFDTLDRSGKEGVSAYVAKDDKIIVSQCSGLVVRPFGPGVKYPPKITDPEPAGFYLTMDTPQGQINATITAAHTILGQEPGPYYRWTGEIKGTIAGGDELCGVASFEQFAWAQ